MRHFRTPAVLLPLLAALVVGAAGLALATGALALTAAQTLSLFGLGDAPLPAYARDALWQLRLPRAVLAVLVGAALGMAGAAMQGVFRNPLADPGLAGVSAGAALGACLWLALQPDWLARWLPAAYALPLLGFAGAAAAAALVLQLARHDGQTSTTHLLLAGVSVNALALAGVGSLQQLASDPALRDISAWMLGSLGKAGWNEIAAGALLLALPLALLPRDARALDALLLGEAEAAHLGIAVERLKRRVLGLCVLAVGASVALVGMVGFIGLVAPHAVRLLLGPGHRALLPGSALLGALLLLADTAARRIAAPLELPVGALTAVLGAPFFLWLLSRARQEWA